MKSILNLFEETKDLYEEGKKQKKYGRSNRYIKSISSLPEFECPKSSSIIHNRDMNHLKWYYDNKSLSSNFLTKSDESVKKVFKVFCKEHNIPINWDYLSDVMKDVNAVIGTLKNKFKRPRPKEILTTEDPKYNDIIDVRSYAFPSGHTTAAHFLYNVIAHFFPNVKKDLNNLADLIGHSRIENCVHYPSDVVAGQLLGELLATSFLENKGIEKELSHLKVKKKDKKKLCDKLNKKQDNFYMQLSDFVDICKFSNSSYDENNLAFKNFLEGYPIEQCTDNHTLQDFLNLCVLGNKLNSFESIYDYISMHKMLNPDYSKPGILRNFEDQKDGYAYSSPENIVRHLNTLSNVTNPFSKHVLFNWIMPFDNNNEMLSAVVLLIETDWDVEKCAEFLSQYDEKSNMIKEKHGNINKLLKYYS